MAAFLALLEKDQRRLLRLCVALETMADGLPASSACRGASRLLALLSQAFDKHIFLHDKCLFPLIRSVTARSNCIEPILIQLEFEHASDQGLVIELVAAFSSAPADKSLGYLLRAFFDNYRRHAAWERNSLYPIVRAHLLNEHPLQQIRGAPPFPLGLRF